ncbi:alkylation response protein AidB-like acyl-CoA dehydrogenase [Actinocorallia herbida]|uniref:Alkylation response protein AidB-like acyl-CoA dehydrogenase n=1 Tax=Actinocorallia herbida TaxID=58109 RepID=A0A3N1CV19_9ACTN|nr:acyl-CoA dehydrogenase family protein [Actinocorallia herbida]ROO85160.1 alkylation response protein AidB-like acyl-CoA dehydrogenase [Actinocorallia herbida]
MALPQDEHHAEIRTALRDLLARYDRASADSRPLWRDLAGLGLFALPVPASRDGLGLGLTASVRAFEDLGGALAPGPLVWTQLAALARPDLADGTTIVTGVDLTAVPEGDPVLVEHLPAADLLLVLDAEGVTLVPRTALRHEELPRPLDPATPMSRLHTGPPRDPRAAEDLVQVHPRDGDGPAVRPPRPPDERLGGAELAGELRDVGTLLSAAFLLGLADRAVTVAVEYARQREQFGRPIGSFQAVKHLLADAHVRTALARAALYAAAETGTSPDLPAAHLLAARAAEANSRTAVQVLGGMGFTWETEPHLLLKRAWTLTSTFGHPEQHALDLADDLLAEPTTEVA